MFINYLPRKIFGYFIESQVGDRRCWFKTNLLLLSLGVAWIYLRVLENLRKIKKRR